MKTEHANGDALKLQTILATGLLVIGAALMTYMIRVESEPGALPLALVLGGLAWLVATRLRVRARRRRQLAQG